MTSSPISANSHGLTSLPASTATALGLGDGLGASTGMTLGPGEALVDGVARGSHGRRGKGHVQLALLRVTVHGRVAPSDRDRAWRQSSNRSLKHRRIGERHGEVLTGARTVRDGDRIADFQEFFRELERARNSVP